jgi:hypothetical protein
MRDPAAIAQPEPYPGRSHHLDLVPIQQLAQLQTATYHPPGRAIRARLHVTHPEPTDAAHELIPPAHSLEDAR